MAPYRYRLLPGGYMDETGPHRGVPPTDEQIEMLKLHHRLIFGPFDMVITTEITIEEAKKRWNYNEDAKESTDTNP